MLGLPAQKPRRRPFMKATEELSILQRVMKPNIRTVYA
jgi:hypothetical protein